MPDGQRGKHAKGSPPNMFGCRTRFALAVLGVNEQLNVFLRDLVDQLDFEATLGEKFKPARNLVETASCLTRRYVERT
jgi:hypothetical protein